MRNTLRYPFATVLTAGLVVAPLTAALADTATDGSGSVAGGNQVVVPVDVQADLCGNALAVLGISSAECDQVSEVLYEASGQGATTDGSGSVAGGNQIIVPVDAAVDACGNAVAVGGVSQADCVEVVEALEEESGAEPASTASTNGSGGVASGNQIIVPVDVALNVCGNSVAILGASSAECTTIINVIQASPENEGGPTTDGSGGVASGNQIIVPVDAAVEICGNAVSVLGLAEAACMEQISDDDDDDGGDGGDDGDGDDGDDTDGGDDSDGGDDGDGGDGGDDSDGGDDGRDDQDDSDGDDSSSTTDDDRSPQADEQLAVTGTALGGLVAAGLAAIGAGGAGLYFARRRRAAAGAGDEVQD